ncbi:MAG: PadR family transcriptional regulator [Phycisphaerales bacterium]
MPRRHSELECFTLGLIWRHGPCSAYDVRMLMQDSPSTQWSASAGAIYPLIRKLEREKLVAGKDEPHGRRARRVFRATRAGQHVLRDWIGPPLAPEAVTVAYDPLRSRARFLSVLPARSRARWVAAALGALDEVARRVKAWDAKYGGRRDAIGAAITRSGELDLSSRRAWLRALERALDEGDDSVSAPRRRRRG